MTLTIYSSDFDVGEKIANGGFSGQCFIEDMTDGVPFSKSKDNLLDALRFIQSRHIPIEKIVYNFSEGGEQKTLAVEFNHECPMVQRPTKTQSVLSGKIHLGHDDGAANLKSKTKSSK